MPALDQYDQCGQDGAVSCRVVWKMTGNETAADLAEWLIGKPLAIAGLILIALVARWLLHRLIDRVVRQTEDGSVTGRVSNMTFGGRSVGSRFGISPTDAATRRMARARTMGSLLKSIVTGVIFTIVLIMTISELGYDVAPLIASAGILGVALGFGAQALVRDFLSGIFMIFEDQYGVGDSIDVGEATGTVEAVGLRVTRLRDVNGTVWYVRNGEILRVGNMSQNWARTVLDVAVAYHEDISRVRRVLADVAHDLWQDDEFRGVVIEEPEIWGVQEVGANGVLIRVALKTAPQEQWAVGRELRQRIKARFDFEGIEVPYPEWVVRDPAHQGSAVAPTGSTAPTPEADGSSAE
ncbi:MULTISPECIES: mechanosensitive ion channel family protein [unclassified Nocardioides]|uniref:mechanosensitive ion channel family protein n=1 Tax=unclassified Nocardioides TaxID=2615069 RepID=UPI0009E6691E|nr:MULTISPECIES: mechanosensitive ion channel family protein [unclassified Nocardioides]